MFEINSSHFGAKLQSVVNEIKGHALTGTQPNEIHRLELQKILNDELSYKIRQLKSKIYEHEQKTALLEEKFELLSEDFYNTEIDNDIYAVQPKLKGEKYYENAND